MNHSYTKVLLLSLFCSALLVKTVHCQSSPVHDSLRHLLLYFQENTKNEKLKQAIKDAQAIYTGNTMNDSLAKKLLKVDSFLIIDLQPGRQMILNYTEIVTSLLQQLHPLREHPYYAQGLNNLANLNRNIGQNEKALPLFQQAIAIRKKVLGEEHPDYARSLNSLALLYGVMGQYEKAMPLFQQSLAIRKKVLGEEHPDYATGLNNMAILYDVMGQYEKALPLYRQALTIRKKVLGEEHPDYAQSLDNLALLNKAIGQNEKALPLSRQALAIRKKVLGEEHPDYARSLVNLANLYNAIGQYENALLLYQQALTITKKVMGEEHPYYAAILGNLAVLNNEMGQYEKALLFYQQALTVTKKVLGEEHPDYAAILSSSGLLYSISGNHTEAYTLFAKAAERKIHHLHQTYSTLSEQEKQNFLDKNFDHFFYLPSVLYTQKTIQPSLANQSYTNELILKGIVLENQQQVLNSIRKSGDSTTLQLYEQWRLNKTLIGKQLLLPIKKRMPYLDSLQEATNGQEQQLSRRAATFRNQQRQHNITAKDVASRLTKGQAAIEFVRFRLYNPKRSDSILYAALVLLPTDTAARFVPLFEEKQLKRLLPSTATKVNPMATIRQLYPGAATKGTTVSSKDPLHRLIWQPLEKYLEGVNKIFYAPAGLLHRVGFGALRAGSGQLLIDKYQLNQVLSTRTVALPVPAANKPGTAAIWGDIAYNLQKSAAEKNTSRTGGMMEYKNTPWGSFNSQSGSSLLRIDSLKETFTSNGVNVSVSSGLAATEERFKALDGKSPQLLHIATHGFFYPAAEPKPNKTWTMNSMDNPFKVHQNPLLRSGLVLAGANHVWTGGKPLEGKEDGILTAYDIAQMDLSGTDLVVLSACQTGLGDVQGNEGVIGLQRAFKLAGVKQVLVSLWEVPAKQTTELMLLFYKRWLEGYDVREALRFAQLKMKENYPPSDWAAFVVVE